MKFTPLYSLDQSATMQRFIRLSIIVLAFEIWGMGYIFQAVLFEDGPLSFGFDFSAFWSAAQLSAEGRALDAFNGEVIGPLERSVIPEDGTLYWHYPPTMQLAVLPLAGMDFGVSYVLSVVLGIVCLVWMALQVEPDRPAAEKLVIISSPFVWMNFVQGQNGAFIALFLVMFLLSLERKRWMWAGFWGALLLVKPHFGVLLPLIVILRGDWRVFAWGGLFGGLFCGATIAAFGIELWQAFWDNREFLKTVLDEGELALQQISGYSFAQQMEWPQSVAIAIQAVTIVLAVAVTTLVWRSDQVSSQLRIATAIVCSLMISPYSFFYDASVSSVAVYLLYRKDPSQPSPRGGQLILLAAWYVIFIYVSTKASAPSYGFYPVFMGLMWLCYRNYLLQTRQTKTGVVAAA